MTTEDIRSICTSFSAVTEDVKWEHDLVFSVGSKMFCVVALDADPVSASFKVSDSDFDEVVSRHGFDPAPYMAKHKWVRIEDINLAPMQEWRRFLTDSYNLVASKLTLKFRRDNGLM